MTQILPEAEVAEIAARFGLPLALVQSDAQHARAQHGKPTLTDWNSDGHGRCDARRLLIGWLEEECRVAEADARSHSEFCRNAY